VENLLQANAGSVVVVDEAYVNFGGVSAVPLVARYPNLLVTHTLSKSRSLAGLRVGYAIGQPELIEALNRVKDSFNSYPLGRLAQAGAVAAMEDQAYFQDTWRRVVESRQRLVAGLQKLNFDVVPSAANFVFARHFGRNGAELAAELRVRGIVVRNFQNPARIAAYLRITVGTDAQCEALLGALPEILNGAVTASPSSALS
jgi:histidinol-phosphate aminotransferase